MKETRYEFLFIQIGAEKLSLFDISLLPSPNLCQIRSIPVELLFHIDFHSDTILELFFVIKAIMSVIALFFDDESVESFFS